MAISTPLVSGAAAAAALGSGAGASTAGFAPPLRNSTVTVASTATVTNSMIGRRALRPAPDGASAAPARGLMAESC